MAYYMNSGFVVVGACVILLAAVADAQLLNALNVKGVINCPNGTAGLPTGPGIPGVTVSLNCTVGGNNVTVGQGVTDANGTFSISVANILGLFGSLLQIIFGGQIPCTVSAPLPINQVVCPLLNATTGLLLGVPRLVNTTLTPLLGLVGNAIAYPVINGTIIINA